MGISLSDAKRLSFWEYRALMAGWNEAHAPPDREALDNDTVRRHASLLRQAKMKGPIQ